MAKTTEKPPVQFDSDGRQFVELNHETKFTLAQERIARKLFSELLLGAQSQNIGDADEAAILALACVELIDGKPVQWTPERYAEWHAFHTNNAAPEGMEQITANFFDLRTASIARGFRIYSNLGKAAEKLT